MKLNKIRTLVPITAAGGRVLWIDGERLAPCWGRQPIMTVRETDDGPVLAVFDGLLLAGVILPETLPEDLRRELRRVSA